jgi:hypothetical protein
MLLGGGKNPSTNTTILSKSTFDAATTASAIVLGSATDDSRSIAGYGMGWLRNSYEGHEVGLRPDNVRR